MLVKFTLAIILASINGLSFYGCGSPKHAEQGSLGGINSPPPAGPTTSEKNEPKVMWLGGCTSPAEDARLSFREERIDLGTNCQTHALRVMDTGDGILAVHRSDCGTSLQIYATKLTYDLKPLRSQHLSQSCEVNNGSMLGLNVTKGVGSALIFGICKSGLNSADVYKIGVDFSTTNLSSSIYESVSNVNLSDSSINFDLSYVGMWNERGSAYGVVSAKGFRRFGETFQSLGGTIDWCKGAKQIALNDGQWIALTTNSCTRTSTEGVPTCSDVYLGIYGYGFNGRTMIGNYTGIFNPGTCTFSLAQWHPDLSIDAAFPGSSVSIKDKYDALLVNETRKTATMLLITPGNSPELVSTIAVTDTLDAKIIDAVIANKKNAIPMVRNGLAFIGLSDQGVE